MIRLLTLALAALALAPALGLAQYYEVGMQAGAASYAGDLTSRGFEAGTYHPSLAVFGRYNHSPRLAARGQVTIAQVGGADRLAADAKQHARNLEFRSPVYELAALAEFNVTPYAIRDNKGSALYVTAGVSGFHFDPRARFNGEWVRLQPLGTEGQGSATHPDRERYRRFAAAIPFGAGFKFAIGNRFNIGAEALFRRAFTDYLDDVSGAYPDVDALYEENPLAASLSFRAPQYERRAMPNPVGSDRGNSDVPDYYMTVQLSLSFNLTHKQGLDFDPDYEIFKDPPPALSYVQPWELLPRA